MTAWEKMADAILANTPADAAVPPRSVLIVQLRASFPEEADMAEEYTRVASTDALLRAAFAHSDHPLGIAEFVEACRSGFANH